MDVVAKVLLVAEHRSVLFSGKQQSVTDVDVVDDSMVNGKNAKAKVALWGNVSKLLTKDHEGHGITFMGCQAKVDPDGSVKINMFESNGRVLEGGVRAESLGAMDTDKAEFTALPQSGFPRRSVWKGWRLPQSSTQPHK